MTPMLTVVTKSSDARSVVIHVSQNGRIIVRKKSERTVPVPDATKNTINGAGTLFNIFGRNGQIRIRRASSDARMMQRDLEMVGQSIYDATLALLK